MKARKIFFLPSLILVTVFIVSCAQVTNSPQTPSRPTPTLVVNTVTSTFTLTPGPTNTPTAIPILSVELAHVRLLGFLANNGGCRLPCLWGITPGSSTSQESRDMLASLVNPGLPPRLSSNPGSIDLTYADEDSATSINLRFLYGDDGIVSRVGFLAQEEKRIIVSNGDGMIQDVFDSKTFGERVRAYMLPQVLTEQGIPAAVLLQTYGSQVEDGGFEIVLFYPNQGLLVHYTTQMQTVGNKVRGCLANAHVEFELYPIGNPASFSQYLAETQWSGLWPVSEDNPSWRPIEKAIPMTLEQFYETFRQPTDKCIETPTKLWPKQ